MPTLAEGIAAKLPSVIRSPGGSSVADDAALEDICEMAADRVAEKLGDVDGTKLSAVMYGIMFVLELWCVRFEQKMDAQQQRLYDSLRKDWEDSSVTLRHEAQGLGISAPDTDVLDETFPNRRVESSDDDE